jgi:hypothetical protein
MAKKSQVPPAPEMTALPMTSGDSPLVIDLPDGQKLVVGNLAAGSVIEVATWRGTGRPDSRTSRLMLGMSSAAQDKPANAANAAGAAPSEAEKEATFVSKLLGVLRTLISKASAPRAAIRKSRTEKKSSAPLIEKVTPAARTSEAGEVDDWLNSILEKSAKKQSSEKDAAVKSTTDKKAAPVKKTVKKAPAKKAVAKKSPKKSTARRAR